MGVGPLAVNSRWPLVLPSRLVLPSLHQLLREGWRADAGRRVLWLPVTMAAGIAAYFWLLTEPPAALPGYLLGLAFLAGAGALALPNRPVLRAPLALIAAFSFGFADAQLRTQHLAAPIIARKAGPLHLTARVESVDPHRGRMRMMLGAIAPIPELGADHTPKRVRISAHLEADQIVPGEWVNVTAVLMPPPEPAIPGAYDFSRVAYFEQIGGVGFAYGYPHKINPPRAPAWREEIPAAIERLRNAITARIISQIGGREGAIAASLVTGKRGAIDEDDTSAFRDAGLAHVLVIAGVHLSLASGCFFWLVRALLAAIPAIALRYPIKKWAAIAALIGAGGFLVISGAAEPATRAFVMLAVMFGAILMDRMALSMRSVALAASIILVLEPEALVAAGFQLSFAAVIGLIARAEWERRRERQEEGAMAPAPWWRPLWRYAIAISLTSLVAGLATAPFSIFHFGRAAQYGVLGNILAMPIVASVVMPAATVAMVAMPFGLDHWPLYVMGRGIWLTIQIAHFVSGLPGATAMVPSFPYAALALTTLGGLWLVIWQAGWRWLGAAAIIAGLVLVLRSPQPDIFISRDGRDVAVRGPDGKLAFLHPPADEFSAQAVLKRDGDNRDTAAAVGGRFVRCDPDGCVARLANGQLLAASARAAALREDCRNSDIVVAAVPTRHRCAGPSLVIDRFDLARNGAYTLTLGASLRIETVRAWRGVRPWSEPPPRRPYKTQYRRIKPTSLPWMRMRSAP